VTDAAVRLHPLAADEAKSAHQWYTDRSIAAAEEFLNELDAAMAAIANTPNRWPRVHDRYRRFLLHKFPFSIVYIQRQDFVEVIAVAHHRRRPGYWKRR
jgi:plasmid stabilization system protein ParE